jgi:ABC-type sugar transport system ATPase subunit
MTAPTTVVSARNIIKSFGATRAVRDVSLEIPSGSIFGLVGENGAGKSTFAKVIAGIHSPDSGALIIGGTEHEFKNPYEGIRAGVSMMAQEITLVPDATIEENVLLGNLPRRGPFPDRGAMRRKYNELVEFTQFDLAPTTKVMNLRIADQQKVEIMRALSQQAQLIIMDEPSAALTTDEVERLHTSIRKIAERGAAVLLISHFLEEVLTLTDHVAIMRDGELVRVSSTTEESVDSLVAGMVGKSLATEYRQVKQAVESPVRLSVQNLERTGVLEDISFDVRAGEIVGLAGLIGAGRTEIARCIFGADKKTGGTITVDGVELNAKSPRDAIKRGVFMVPESRKEQGLVLVAPISDNLLLASYSRLARFGITSGRKLKALAASLAEKVDLRFTNIQQPAGSLSGGNQQKILFGRAFELQPVVMIVDEPTRGVDIAAKRAIHATLEAMAAEGMAVLFISSEIEEVLGVCNRVLVIHRGRVQAEFNPPYDQEAVVSAFFGKSGMPHD